MYRLFIDIPISANSREDAVIVAHKLISPLILSGQAQLVLKNNGVDQVNYRLGHDEDRQNRNYLVIDYAGHASTKKTKITVSLDPGNV